MTHKNFELFRRNRDPARKYPGCFRSVSDFGNGVAMHPIFIFIMIACAGWFFGCAGMAGRGIGVRIGSAVLGVVVFLVVFAALEQIIKIQLFFLQALFPRPDVVPIMMYITLSTLIVVFLSGFWLKKILTRSDSADS